ncbi:C39 family peptidase [Aquirhabdus parva]|nr:C39 family peptidase [Aquirhabdus parva]
MLLLTLGSALMYNFAADTFDTADIPGGSVYYTELTDSRLTNNSSALMHQRPVVVKPLSSTQFRGIVKQAYDYSCGSAALTTLLNGYMAQTKNEREVMDGLLKYGEYDRIIQRRSFSLLDMKRYVNAIGFNSNGFRGTFQDLVSLDKPAIVPIAYAGFKHFVVYKAFKDGHVFVADPALGNISFTAAHFQEVWDNSIMFIITPDVGQPTNNLLALQDGDMRVIDDALINQFALVDVKYPELGREQQRDAAATMQRVIDSDPNSPTYNKAINTSLRLYYSGR